MLSGDRQVATDAQGRVARGAKWFQSDLAIAYLVAVPLADHVFWVQQNYLINKMTNSGRDKCSEEGDSISSHTQFGESAADQ